MKLIELEGENYEKSSRQFLDGMKAAYFGAAEHDCPYHIESFPLDAEEWKAGWRRARIEILARTKTINT